MRSKSWQGLKFDARTLRAASVAFFGFGGVGLLVLVGARAFGVTGVGVEAWLSGFAGGPWALPAAIGMFAALAFVGAPQFILIAAAVAAFGPLRGAGYSWAGTMVSSLVGFGLGRRFAAGLVGAHAGAGLKRFARMVGRNGLAASLLVRLVPAAPFMLVNMAAGATPMATGDFLIGTAIGIVPKIAITALGAAGFGAAAGHGLPLSLSLIGAALLLWAGLGWAARAWARRWDVSDD
jgi:uncharacterized membrane protein YdjX (TVP38/TMEM64 family)